MEKIVVERSIWINASRERVWKAMTDPEQVVRWFVPNLPFAEMKRDDSGKITMYLGEMGIDLIILDMIDPPQQASIRSLPDRQLATIYHLEEQDGGTQVTVTIGGFESLSEDAGEDRLNLSGAGWEKALENLKAYVDGNELPFPQAYVGPLFGYWREPRKKVAVERSIWIKASRERVWRAITDPDEMEHWFSPGTHWQGTGPEVGGKLFVYDSETKTEMYTQVIDVVDAPNRLVTRSLVEPPEITHITTWSLVEENGGTRLMLTYSGYELEPDDRRWNSMEENTFGFGMMLENVQAYVEGKRLPYPGGF